MRRRGKRRNLAANAATVAEAKPPMVGKLKGDFKNDEICNNKRKRGSATD